jgi:hypothetical protein
LLKHFGRGNAVADARKDPWFLLGALLGRRLGPGVRRSLKRLTRVALAPAGSELATPNGARFSGVAVVDEGHVVAMVGVEHPGDGPAIAGTPETERPGMAVYRKYANKKRRGAR